MVTIMIDTGHFPHKIPEDMATLVAWAWDQVVSATDEPVSFDQFYKMCQPSFFNADLNLRRHASLLVMRRSASRAEHSFAANSEEA